MKNEYDADDPPPEPTENDHYWFYANRAAESFLRWLRFWGII